MLEVKIDKYLHGKLFQNHLIETLRFKNAFSRSSFSWVVGSFFAGLGLLVLSGCFGIADGTFRNFTIGAGSGFGSGFFIFDEDLFLGLFGVEVVGFFLEDYKKFSKNFNRLKISSGRFSLYFL